MKLLELGLAPISNICDCHRFLKNMNYISKKKYVRKFRKIRYLLSKKLCIDKKYITPSLLHLCIIHLNFPKDEQVKNILYNFVELKHGNVCNLNKNFFKFLEI